MTEFLNRISHYSPKRLALLADELQSRVVELEQARREPIAIVGIGCRFPGGANTPEQLWELVRAGVDAVGEVPRDRWDIDALYDPDPDAPGKMATRWGGFLDEVDRFDPHFFGISPREAQTMDPQQRLLLEVAWRALEHAGISPQRLDSTRAGVFVGISAADYYQIIRAGGVASLDAYTASGVAHSIASGRLSYFLGLRGPSVSIDTACSSSLVAIHLAVSSLRRGESDLALAGGANLLLGPDISIALTKAKMMAPDGRCKAFDSRADGFVRGEGCGILVLKRLRDAEADGDRIIAVIRGSAANQDGRSNGLTAPNGPSQEAVLREALTDAGVQPHEIGYVEAHGTGTALGDPIEIQALGAVLGVGRAADQPLLVGSVKANIGHLEAAAGVAGLIKLAMVLQHGEIPAQIHLLQPNPHIAWSELPVRVPTSRTPWPARLVSRRLGGISSFGFSGTNVHIVLEQAPAQHVDAAASARVDRPLHVLTVSARNENALRILAAAYRDRLRSTTDTLPDIASTANSGRAHFAHRAAIVTDGKSDAAETLERLTVNEAGSAATATASVRGPRVAFLFTGQGSQYPGMARALFETSPPFRAAIEKCAELLDPLLDRPLLSVLFSEPGSASPIDDTEYTQPALFAVEYALARLWLSWGIRPAAVMGHSVGEFAAACIAGVFSLEDGLKLIAARGRLMGALPRNGAMVVVNAGEAEVAARVAPWDAEVGVAASNGPTNTVISGERLRVESIVAELEESGIRCTPLKVSHAFHSPLMRPMLAEFERVLAEIRFSPPQIDLFSNVTGEIIGAAISCADYWRDHVLAPVRFDAAIRAAVRSGCDAFLEIGPHPTLLGMARECVDGASLAWLPSLREGKPDWQQILTSLAQLYVRGAEVDWKAFDAPYVRRRVSLPGYPFQRERYWIETSTASRLAEPRVATPQLHPLLGSEVRHSLGPARLFEATIDLSRFSYLEDHQIGDALLMPSPALMEMALAAAGQQFGAGVLQLDDFTVHQPLHLDPSAAATVQLVLNVSGDGRAEFRISSFDPEERVWQPHASGRVTRCRAAAAPVDIGPVRARTTAHVGVPAYYERLASLGLHFGERFRGAESILRCDGEVLARMHVPAALADDFSSYLLHPAVVDACLHLIGAGLPDAGEGLRDPFLLLNVEHIRVFKRPPQSFWTHVELEADELRDVARQETFRATVRLLDDAGSVLAELDGVHLKRAPAAALTRARLPARIADMVHEIVWRETPGMMTAFSLPQDIAERVLPRLPGLAARNGLDAYAYFQRGLDALAAGYIADALLTLGWSLVPGDVLDPEALRSELGVLERHRRLFVRMLDILAEEGVLSVEESQWRVLGGLPRSDGEALFGDLSTRHPDCAAELMLTRRCGLQLADVLRGRTDPLSLLFPGGSLSDTESLYQNSPPARTYNALIADIVAGLRDAAAIGRPLRILEIGAGTGSTTSYVLRELQDLEPGSFEYTFTDVSPLFLDRAAEKFRGHQPGLHFRTLDIARDPSTQGFARESFDVVIAANVLHATPDLDATLANVRTLMQPGGLVILLEGTTPQRFGDLTVGLLEGWWAFADTHRRSYALLPRAAWLDLLNMHGFESAVAVPGEHSGPVLSQQAILLARASAKQAATAARWLIVPDGAGFAEVVAENLRQSGDTAEILASTDAALLRAALRTPCAGLLYLPALDTSLTESTTAEELLAGQRDLMTGALRVVQMMASEAVDGMARLFMVTRGAQATCASESADPAQATLWGLSHVVALEHPELACTRIDLDPAAAPVDAATMLVAELRAASREDQLAFRGRRRLARRLVKCSATRADLAPNGLPIRTDRSYLVTGGLRGLGPRLAEWLAEQGARHLVLAGRREPDVAGHAFVQQLRERGVEVLVVSCDIGVRADVERLLAEIAARTVPLAGIVHAAGVLDDGVLAAQSWERFAPVMGPKVVGTWFLHTLARDLDFLVLFSSGASLAGSAGQANHAAANAFEDALAWYRQSRGLPTVSINWGPWARIGAAADREVDATGLRPMEPDDALAALGALLRGDVGRRFRRAQCAVFVTDWTHLLEPAAAGRLAPLFDELLGDVRREFPLPENKTADSPIETSLRERICAAAPNRRKTVLRDFVRQRTALVLGARPDDLDFDEPLRQLGLDSLMAVELRNQLGSAAQRTLPATLTFDHPSIGALVEYLATEVFAEEIRTPAGTGTDATPQSALDALSEDELAARLARRLESLGSLERT